MESLSQILEHRESKYSLTALLKGYPRITVLEKKIVQARLDGVSFCQIEEGSIRFSTDQIMLKGAAISGCALPNTEGFASIISGELVAFILEFGYGNLTLNEILLALRMNAAGDMKYPSGDAMESVPFHGNCFNVDYIAKVLHNYMLLRNSLDSKLKNKIDGY